MNDSEMTILEPQFKLTGVCGNDVQNTLLQFDDVTNSQPWHGHEPGSLYVSAIEFGGNAGDEGAFEIGFRKRSATEGSFQGQEAIDFATLPVGTWSEVAA